MDSSRQLTRKEFDEVIRRAAEIAASEPEGSDSSLTEKELFRIAGEVGLDERHVQKALVQVRTSPPTGRGPVAALYGPSYVTVSRVVPGIKVQLARVIDEFLVAGRLLQTVRSGPSVLQYRPAVDWASQIARAASSTSRKHYVASAKRVEVHLEQVDEDHTLVEFEVEPGTRDDYVVGGIMGGLAGGGGVGVGIGFAVAAAGPAALAVAAGVLAGGAFLSGLCWTTGYYHKKRLLEVRAELEGVLDRLEAGESLEPPPVLAPVGATALPRCGKRTPWRRRPTFRLTSPICHGEKDPRTCSNDCRTSIGPGLEGCRQASGPSRRGCVLLSKRGTASAPLGVSSPPGIRSRERAVVRGGKSDKGSRIAPPHPEFTRFIFSPGCRGTGWLGGETHR